MKFGIIIQDLDANQAANLLKQLTNENETVQVIPGASYKQIDEYAGSKESTGNEGEFDSKGMPWDERIHASTKRKNKDGTWQRGRNVDEAVFASVEAELKGSPAPVMGNAPTPAAVGYVAPVVVPTVALAPVAPVAAPSVAPMAPPIPTAVPVSAPVAISRDFKGLMQQISNLFSAKVIDPSYPNTIVARINAHSTHFGGVINTLTDIANDPRRIEYAWQCLDADNNGLNKAA